MLTDVWDVKHEIQDRGPNFAIRRRSVDDVTVNTVLYFLCFVYRGSIVEFEFIT